MEAVAPHGTIVDRLMRKGTVEAADVEALRRDVFRDGVVNWDEARQLLALHRCCADKDGAWDEFYVDALTDFLVWKSEPPKYVDPAKARFVLEEILSDGRIESASELELLANVVYWAASCPETLVERTLDAVRQSVLDPDHAAYGEGRRPGVIDAVDVELIKRVIFAGSSDGGYTVTQREAETLIALNNATDADANAPEWHDLFVKGVANYLMFPKGAPEVPDAAEYSRREAWLESRRGIGGLLMEVGRTVGRAAGNFGSVWEQADPFGTRRAREEAARQERATREALAREAVTAEEARWLIDKLGPADSIGANEKALLRFIRDEGTSIAPEMQAYIDAADL